MPTINRLPKKKPTYHKAGDNIIASKIYNSPQWKRLRAWYIMEHPLCERCLAKNNGEGVIRAATEVHHIRPILTGATLLEMKDLAYNPENLMSLCTECHHKIHKEMKM